MTSVSHHGSDRAFPRQEALAHTQAANTRRRAGTRMLQRSKSMRAPREDGPSVRARAPARLDRGLPFLCELLCLMDSDALRWFPTSAPLLRPVAAASWPEGDVVVPPQVRHKPPPASVASAASSHTPPRSRPEACHGWAEEDEVRAGGRATASAWPGVSAIQLWGRERWSARTPKRLRAHAIACAWQRGQREPAPSLAAWDERTLIVAHRACLRTLLALCRTAPRHQHARP